MSNKFSGRINIYVDDPDLRRNVRLAAAFKSTSISEYCLSAIREKLERDESRSDVDDVSMKQAVRNARRFQTRVFGRKIFSVSSAQLIREARKSRSGR